MLRIFLVEDDEAIARNLIRLLRAEGFSVTHALTRGKAHETLAGDRFDLALVDISLLDGNGFAVCTEIKENGDIPVIFLTASDDEASVVTGFHMGADDYVTKPFSLKELAARVRAVIRRQEYLAAPEAQSLSGGGLELDYSRRRVLKNGEPVELTQREFELLYTLMKSPGRVFTREMLLDTVWKVDFYGDTRTVDVHVRYLRQKLEDEPDNPKRILTVRGVGYRFTDEP